MDGRTDESFHGNKYTHMVDKHHLDILGNINRKLYGVGVSLSFEVQNMGLGKRGKGVRG